MMTILLCAWSALVIFLCLVRMKFYWTRPQWQLLLYFAGAGVASTMPSLICNLFLSEKTQFWAFDPDRFNSFMGFWIGAGMGEEFWKFACGLLVVVAIRRDLGDANRVLGFVIVGIMFGTIENIVTYSGLNTQTLILRGFVSVPIHAAMGVIHGLAVNRARRSCVAWPLFAGYFLAAGLHTLCDTWSLFLPTSLIGVALILSIATLTLGSAFAWRRIAEVPGLQRPRRRNVL
jgi:RsiW-degrading membrane proteinase PrsW (M82 family)